MSIIKKNRNNASIYAKRANDATLREIVRNLSEKEKKSDEFKDIVAYVELLRARKRIENQKYKESKRLYCRRKSTLKKLQQQEQLQEKLQYNLLDKDLEKYQFDIFHLLPS